jgi:predicted ATPase/class 3 adenylate cyclase
MRVELPSGTVTFLFTDLASSTRLWEERAEAMGVALARHDEILREAVESRGGVVVKTTGDGLHAVFASADSAVAAAVAGQLALSAEPWDVPGGLHVRMGLHTGVAEQRDGDYYGPVLNRAARLMATAHGDQIVCSQATAELVRDSAPGPISLTELGKHRLKDLTRAEVVFQIAHPDLPSSFAPLTSVDAFPGNLPVQRSPLIGRSRELTRLVNALDDHRIVTLTGVGGVGKTRLALQLAADVLDRFPDGAWFVALASIRDPTLVPTTLATTLGVIEQPGHPVMDTVCAGIGARELLLVLDNCEHLLDATARAVDELLDACAALQIVVTSREALGVDGEQSFPTPSLSLPGSASASSPTDIARSDAVGLFVDRARAADPDFELSEANAAAVAGLCQRLDGIPLAIELAAARVNALAPRDLLERIDQRFLLLTGGSRTALERHQTLQAAVDWSYDLLSADEQRLFRSLSVFAGTFDLDAARAVAGADEASELALLDQLGNLVAKSMVVADRTPSTTRYRLLETLRQYGRDRFASADEVRASRDRHAHYYAALSDSIEQVFFSPRQPEMLDQLEFEADNIRAAFDWLVETRDAPALRKITHLGGGVTDTTEAYRRCEALLDLLEALPNGEQVDALGLTAWLAFTSGEHERALELAEASVAAADRAGLEPPVFAFSVFGMVAFWRGDGPSAVDALEQGVVSSRAGVAEGHVRPSWLAMSLAGLCFAYGQMGRTDEAVVVGEEAVAIAREVGAPTVLNATLWQLGLAVQATDPERAAALLEDSLHYEETTTRTSFTRCWAYLATGQLRSRLGDVQGAVRAFAEALRTCRRTGERFQAPVALQAMAGAMRRVDRPEDAARLLGAAQRLSAGVGITGGPADVQARARAKARLRELLGDERFEAAWNDGQALDFEAAVSAALEVARGYEGD